MIETLDDFARRLADLLEIELSGPVSPSDSLFELWRLDSLQAFQLLIVVESLAGVAVPPVEIPEIFTVQDAYSYFLALSALAEG